MAWITLPMRSGAMPDRSTSFANPSMVPRAGSSCVALSFQMTVRPSRGSWMTRSVEVPPCSCSGKNRCVVHSALILPCFTTFAQRSRSLVMYAANAAGPCPSGSKHSARRAFPDLLGICDRIENILASDALMSSG